MDQELLLMIKKRDEEILRLEGVVTELKREMIDWKGECKLLTERIYGRIMNKKHLTEKEASHLISQKI